MHNDGVILLAIRGSLRQPVLDEVRKIHNDTAGNPQGVAAARALGDLSHNVYVPLQDKPEVATELLIMDLWNSFEGLQKFFSDPQVQAGGGLIFSSRDPVVFADAGVQGFTCPTPKAKTERYVGILRGTVTSRDAAKAAFDAYCKRCINAARMKGQISHAVYFRATPPGAPESLELIGVDTWMDAEGMQAFYTENAPDGNALYEQFETRPATSLWKQPAGQWVEW